MILKVRKMEKENKCPVFNRKIYCLQLASDCYHCQMHLNEYVDCQGQDTTNNFKEKKEFAEDRV